MKELKARIFLSRLFDKKEHYPFSGQIELTYRCNLDCVHCYCKGIKPEELTTQEWKKIFDEIHREGCLNLCLTGGEPLVRNDFLELYAYVKAKGFIVTLFTNGQLFTSKIIDYLVKSPPSAIEITLNGINKETYEAITQIPGSFCKIMERVKLLKEKNLPLILKSNCLKQNKNEVPKIKAFTKKLFTDLPKNKFRFKYDVMIYPGYNGNKAPCNYRLSFRELSELRKQDPDIWKQYQEGLTCKFAYLKIAKDLLYNCNAWQQNFFINPSGRLKFCASSDKFSADLKTTSFRDGFYNIFPKLLNEKFKTNSKCRDCRLRPICYYCPARAYLETGNEEGPVEYYCELAEATYREMEKANANPVL